MPVRILTIHFKGEIKPFEVSLFRGAVINSLEDRPLLFHDHTEEGFRYSYPLIQYKRLNGKAAIVCLGKGTEQIEELLYSNISFLTLGSRRWDAEISGIDPKEFDLQVSDDLFKYHLQQWLPLNEDNFRKYSRMEGIVERIFFLEKILTGNILSFAKGIGVHLDVQVTGRITSLSEPYVARAKGVRMACFNVDFQTNVTLPDNIGLGKHASIGFGVVSRIRTKK